MENAIIANTRVLPAHFLPSLGCESWNLKKCSIFARHSLMFSPHECVPLKVHIFQGGSSASVWASTQGLSYEREPFVQGWATSTHPREPSPSDRWHLPWTMRRSRERIFVVLRIYKLLSQKVLYLFPTLFLCHAAVSLLSQVLVIFPFQTTYSFLSLSR